ncbi:MAG: septum formation inhibitor Maf [Deltaproteobacteria bacterium]|jgi:septum formation protein|nr:septum formation inhibitor Maf [Deltaproteobacteria bacterium]
MRLSTPFQVEARLILASASPRRRILLQTLGLEFEIIEAGIEERPEADETPCEFVMRAACDKAAAVSSVNHASWVLGADTVVVHGNRILGKPKDPGEALNVLLSLSGQKHLVYTGFCLKNTEAQVSVSRMITTEVYFINFSREIAAAYVATGEPLDKAGAYGIQGIGGFLVEKINGSYSNVVGLPLCEVMQELLGHKVVMPR